MKSKIIIFSLILLTSIYSCKKTDTASTEPQSAFKVSNQVNNTVSEGQVLKLTDQSVNAASYHWDFGNGTTSDKANPDFYYVMHGNYVITLTVTNSKGIKSTSTYNIIVLCTFLNPNHTALNAPSM